jgi:hypothetical protein
MMDFSAGGACYGDDWEEVRSSPSSGEVRERVCSPTRHSFLGQPTYHRNLEFRFAGGAVLRAGDEYVFALTSPQAELGISLNLAEAQALACALLEATQADRPTTSFLEAERIDAEGNGCVCSPSRTAGLEEER